MLESSRAAQCPSVAYQLAGAKKVQQDLAGRGVVESFVDGPEEAALIRACFAGASCVPPQHEAPQTAVLVDCAAHARDCSTWSSEHLLEHKCMMLLQCNGKQCTAS